MGGQAEKKTFLEASRTPQGPLLGSHLGGQNRSEAVVEALPGQVWNDFGLPNGLPKEVLEASSRPSKTSSFQLGLLGGLRNGFWRPFGPLGAGF